MRSKCTNRTILETRERAGLIRLNRPEAAQRAERHADERADRRAARFRRDEAIGAIVLTGSDKAFAAGADIDGMKDYSFMDVYRSDFFTRNWEALRQVRKPVIAAVMGYALGGGCEVAMMCDMVIAGDNARFGQPEIKLGIMPGAGGTQRLPRADRQGQGDGHDAHGRTIDAARSGAGGPGVARRAGGQGARDWPWRSRREIAADAAVRP